MPISKEEFDKRIDRVSKNTPTIEEILKQGKHTAKQIADKTGLSQGTVWNSLVKIKGIKHKRPYWWL